MATLKAILRQTIIWILYIHKMLDFTCGSEFMICPTGEIGQEASILCETSSADLDNDYLHWVRYPEVSRETLVTPLASCWRNDCLNRNVTFFQASMDVANYSSMTINNVTAEDESTIFQCIFRHVNDGHTVQRSCHFRVINLPPTKEPQSTTTSKPEDNSRRKNAYKVPLGICLGIFFTVAIIIMFVSLRYMRHGTFCNKPNEGETSPDHAESLLRLDELDSARFELFLTRSLRRERLHQTDDTDEEETSLTHSRFPNSRRHRYELVTLYEGIEEEEEDDLRQDGNNIPDTTTHDVIDLDASTNTGAGIYDSIKVQEKSESQQEGQPEGQQRTQEQDEVAPEPPTTLPPSQSQHGKEPLNQVVQHHGEQSQKENPLQQEQGQKKNNALVQTTNTSSDNTTDVSVYVNEIPSSCTTDDHSYVNMSKTDDHDYVNESKVVDQDPKYLSLLTDPELEARDTSDTKEAPDYHSDALHILETLSEGDYLEPISTVVDHYDAIDDTSQNTHNESQSDASSKISSDLHVSTPETCESGHTEGDDTDTSRLSTKVHVSSSLVSSPSSSSSSETSGSGSAGTQNEVNLDKDKDASLINFNIVLATENKESTKNEGGQTDATEAPSRSICV